MCNMNNVRPLKSSEFVAVAGWLAKLPLLVRYGLTAETAHHQLEEATTHGELLLTAENPQGQPIGLAWVIDKGAFGRSAYLRLLGIHPDHIGQGLGSTLLHAAETHITGTNRELFLLVSDFNTAAQRFYQRLGYSQIGAIPGYILPDVTELIFWKRPPGR